MDLPPGLLDPLGQDVEDLAEALDGVAQLLPHHAPAPGRHSALHLSPDPGHVDPVVVSLSEFAPQHWTPEGVVGPPSGVLSEPVRRGDGFQLSPRLPALQVQGDQSQPDAVGEAQRCELEQIQRRHEVVYLAVVEGPHLGVNPPHSMPQADLLDELDDGGVAGEEVVVPALQPPSADVEGGGLSA